MRRPNWTSSAIDRKASMMKWCLLALLMAAGFAGGCSDDGFPISDRRPTNALCFARTAPPPAGPLRFERVFTERLPPAEQLDKAIQLAQSPRDRDVWYLALQPGQILTFSAAPAGFDAINALDLSDRIRLETSENGLVSLALHPQRALAYVIYTAPPAAGSGFVARLSSFAVQADHRFDAASEEVLLEVHQRVQAHSMNYAAFGPDGYLYVAIGEDQRRTPAQDPGSVYGTILRIDVDVPDPIRGTAYSIPEDNPFKDGLAPEVFAYGFRNPWRFSFDRGSGEMIVGDVGHDTVEELDVVIAGGNYGWPVMEGSGCFEAEVCDPVPYTLPLLEYTHAEGRSVTAGYRYQGTQIPQLQGRYVFGDYKFGKIWSSAATPQDQTLRVEAETGFNIPSFFEDAEGELYFVRYSFGGAGGIYKIVRNDSEPGDFPQLLSETGCVDGEDPTRPAPGVVPYAPIAELWSDGAEKARYMAIPDNARISVSDDGDFTFPVGTVLMKHFGFDGVLHETRLLMRTGDGWSGYSYEWNEQGTDAVLLESGKARVLGNGVRWQFPSRSECNVCHTEAAGYTLGPEISQLDQTFAYEGGALNQLSWLFERDYFHPSVESLDELRNGHIALPDPKGDASNEERTRAYLHANCSICHRPDGTSRTEIDLRYSTPFAEMGVCGEEPEQGGLWGVDAPRADQLIVTPGDPESSVMYLRVAARTLFQMPPLGSGIADPLGVDLVKTWIESITNCPN